ncbi:MAG: menaquinone biosynthesis protein [Phycisphaerales bacterium]
MHRFCVLPYVNALPLVHFLPQVDPRAELIYRTPRSAVGTLLEGEVDAAIIPVADFFGHPELTMVPGLGICADGDVTSVLLQCRRPLQQVRVIDLDLESRTSNALVRVLMRDHFRMPHPIEYGLHAREADACVCIGDRALRATETLETYDLAGEWKKMTGLPFVFAVWAIRQSCPDADGISQILHQARDRGCGSLNELAGLSAERLGLPEERCHEYLSHCLHYDVGLAELAGMNRFRELVAGLSEPTVSRIMNVNPKSEKGRTIPILPRS